MHSWPLRKAGNQLSELVDAALSQGPQMITRRGAETVVVLSVADYRKLTRSEESLVDFFRNSPLKGIDLERERAPDTSREVEL